MAGEDPAYVDWIRRQRCLAIGMEGHRCKGPVQAHHAGSRVGRPVVKGGDRRAHDRTAIPICLQAHTELHDASGPFRAMQKAAKRLWQDDRIAETQARWELEQRGAPDLVPPAEPFRLELVPSAPPPPNGWRISSLPVAEHCGLSPAIAAEHPEAPGRGAFKGKAYHARVARQADAADLMALLTEAERTEVEGWALPTDEPAGAEHEIALGLTMVGRYSPHGTAGNLTDGTTDVAWATGAAAELTAVVGDYKTGALHVEDGPRSLQLVGYGFAYANKIGAQHMRLGIWYAREARWDWGAAIALDSPEAADLWRRVTVAATNPPIAAPGPWCDSCFQRHRCPARLLPALAGPLAPELAPFVAGAADLTPAAAATGLRVIAAMREVADRAEEHLRAAVRGGLQLVEGGKIYGPSMVAGRRSADVASLEAAGLTEYIKPARPYERWGWRRA